MGHVEVERKFDVTDDAVCPSLEGHALIAASLRLPTQTLEAVYYDTARHDLSAHRVALRRRTGGSDEGWHLKLPSAGPGARAEARTEVHAPLGAEVPTELRDTVAAIVRDRPLVPVARIRNRRDVTVLSDHDGTTLAEFCDDRVTASRLNPVDGHVEQEQRWREWELELADPTTADADELLDRLTDQILAAGAHRAAHSSKLAKILGDTGATTPRPADPVHRAVAEQVERLLESDRAVRADAHDAVHQMRVATRQIRSLLQASEDAFGLTDDAWVLSELRELAAILGVARDAEVLAQRYQQALDSLAPELIVGPVRERLVDGAHRRYREGLRRSLAAMRSPRYFRLLDTLDTLVVSAPSRDSGEHTTLDSSYRKVRKAVKSARHAQGALRDHALHQVRKASKRLRYVAAATGAAEVEKHSKEIQTLLGDHQDSVVSREHLLEQAGAARGAGEDTFTYGVLHRMESELATRCEDGLDAALKALRRAM